MIVCAALVVPPTSTVYAPQELAHKRVALDYGNGTAYAGLQMLEGAMPREAVSSCAGRDESRRAIRGPDAGRFRRDRAAGAVDHGGREGGMPPGLDHVLSRHLGRPSAMSSTEAYAALLRGITRAVRRINADKRRYVSYFIRDWSGHPEVAALRPDDFNLSRIQLKEPGPIPEHEARWAWEWMASWGLIEGAFDVTTQINRKVEREAHDLATTPRAM